MATPLEQSAQGRGTCSSPVHASTGGKIGPPPLCTSAQDGGNGGCAASTAHPRPVTNRGAMGVLQVPRPVRSEHRAEGRSPAQCALGTGQRVGPPPGALWAQGGGRVPRPVHSGDRAEGRFPAPVRFGHRAEGRISARCALGTGHRAGSPSGAL